MVTVSASEMNTTGQNHTFLSESSTYISSNNIYPTLGYVLNFFNFCTGLIATGLNSFVIYVLLIKRGLSHIHGTDLFVVGMTTTELMTGFTLIFSICSVFIDFKRSLCLFQATMLCSAMFVIIMTSDRYFKIVHPYLYQRVCSLELVPAVITPTVYVFSFPIGFLPLMGAGVHNDSAVKWKECNYLKVLEVSFRISYLVLMFIPIITALLLYSKIFHVAKQQIESIAKTQGLPSVIPRGRYLKMIFIMAGVYMLFYVPPAFTSILSDTVLSDMNSMALRTLFHFSSVGLIANCIVNPIIYAYTVPVVKNHFRLFMGLPVEADSVISLYGDSTTIIRPDGTGMILKVVHSTIFSNDENKKDRQRKSRSSKEKRQHEDRERKRSHKKESVERKTSVKEKRKKKKKGHEKDSHRPSARSSALSRDVSSMDRVEWASSRTSFSTQAKCSSVSGREN